MLIADGETASTTFAEYLLQEAYTQIGARLTTDTYDPTSPPELMLNVMIDTSYRNKQHTTTCQVYPVYGGGTCEPNDQEKEIFAAMNLVRTDPWNEKIQDAFTAILASFIGDVSTYDYYGANGNGEINRTYQEGSASVTEAQTFLQNEAMSGSQLDALFWSPGLYHSATEQGAYIINDFVPTTTGSGGSTPA